MPIPDELPPLRTYYDPRLWDRLERRVREKLGEKQSAVLAGNWTTLEQVRGLIGWVKALEWVLGEASQLTRVEDEQGQ